MKINPSSLLASSLVLALASPLRAAESPKTDLWGCEVPAYLNEASLTAKLGYDSNVYLADSRTSVNGHPQLARQEAALANLSPKFSFNGIKLWSLDANGALKNLNFGYSGDYAFFEGHTDENSYRHAFPVSLKAKQGDWSFAFDNTLLYVDGSKGSPLYSMPYSAYATAMARERREQVQDRLSSQLRFDQESLFVRAAFTALLYDLRTELVNSPGWQNWVDRSDLNGGLDFGFKASKDLALVAGWRIGSQTQDLHPWGGKHCEATYNRFLLGFEGKLCSWLAGSVAVGPDQRRYSDKSRLGLTGAKHTWRYAEGSLNATLGDSDSLVYTGKIWHWVSSTGTASYEDVAHSLVWKHAFGKSVAACAGLRYGSSDYDAPVVRHDTLLSYPVSLTWTLAKEAVLSADYQYSDTKNLVRRTGAAGRDYEQHLVSVSLRLAL